MYYLKIKPKLASFVTLFSALAASGAALAQPFLGPITVEGKALTVGGERFMVRGVALSSNEALPGLKDNIDLLSDGYYDYVKNIILPKLQELNVNTVRVYQVDPTLGHDKVMNLLQDNGIYVMVGTASSAGGKSINDKDPKYEYSLYQRATSVVDAFKDYENVLAFSVGNEVVDPGGALAYVVAQGKCDGDRSSELCGQAALNIEKQALATQKFLSRDLKRYMSESSMRAIPVGMVSRDINDQGARGLNPALFGNETGHQYMACGDQVQARIDYIGINSYRYNSNNGTPANSYDSLALEQKNNTVPVIITESGDYSTSPLSKERKWDFVPYMWSHTNQSDVFSGYVAFQFFNKTENEGLYIEDVSDRTKDLIEAKNGGAKNLTQANNTVQSIAVPFPAKPTQPAECPAVFQGVDPDITINFENHSDKPMVFLEAADDTAPGEMFTAQMAPGKAGVTLTTKDIPIHSGKKLLVFMFDPKGTWVPVCVVKADTLKTGATVANNVEWGWNSCNVR